MTTLVEKGLIGTDGPIQFRLHSIKSKILCLCGILDYHNKGDDLIFIPDWMQEYMNASEGDNIFFSEIKLQKLTYLKLKPESCDFYEIHNHEMQLTNALQNYSGICQGQWIRLKLEEKPMWFQVVKCEPELASVVNTNVKTEFDAADNLEEYENKKAIAGELNKMTADNFFSVNGRTANSSKTMSTVSFTLNEASQDDENIPSVSQKQFSGQSRRL